MSYKDYHEDIKIQDDLHLKTWIIDEPKTYEDKRHSAPDVNEDVRTLPPVVLFHRCPEEVIAFIFIFEKLRLVNPNKVHHLVLKPTEEYRANDH